MTGPVQWTQNINNIVLEPFRQKALIPGKPLIMVNSVLFSTFCRNRTLFARKPARIKGKVSTDGSDEVKSSPGSTLSLTIVQFDPFGRVLYRLAMIIRLIGLSGLVSRGPYLNVVA